MADVMTSSTGGSSQENLVRLSDQPLVAETPLGQQVEKYTPNDRWFIRNHFNIPRLNVSEWQLSVGGAVTRPLRFTLRDLRSLPSRRVAATMECAGNARSYLPPPTDGNPFKYGAASAAVFTGVPVADVFAGAGLAAGVQEIVFRGADRGFEKNVGGEINFERSLPLDVAMHPDTLLVYEMNGEPLPVDHGYPLRLVVPGWYGVASVKWLVEIEATYRPFDGYFQRLRYILPGGPRPTPLRERRVRSVIIWPADRQRLKAGPVEVRGLAWSGNRPVARVELSADGGRSWQAVDLEAPDSPYAWQRWRAVWHATPGSHTLQVRAADTAGRTQPEHADWNFLGYANNSIQNVLVEVTSGE
jgi:DMSO/TMAO reductase YedYZ molybdopterin-dependent catalytic subunit